MDCEPCSNMKIKIPVKNAILMLEDAHGGGCRLGLNTLEPTTCDGWDSMDEEATNKL